VPDPYLFLGAIYTALHLRYTTAPFKENKTVEMAYFWMGSYLRTKKMTKKGQTTPCSWEQPPTYCFIKKFLKRFNLENEDLTLLTNHKSMLFVLKERERTYR